MVNGPLWTVFCSLMHVRTSSGSGGTYWRSQWIITVHQWVFNMCILCSIPHASHRYRYLPSACDAQSYWYCAVYIQASSTSTDTLLSWQITSVHVHVNRIVFGSSHHISKCSTAGDQWISWQSLDTVLKYTVGIWERQFVKKLQVQNICDMWYHTNTLIGYM